MLLPVITFLSKKKPQPNKGMRLKKFGDDLLSRCYAVPSALMGLTSLFGMGRGGPHRYRHLKSLVVSHK